jgi:hypothetical protein
VEAGNSDRYRIHEELNCYDFNVFLYICLFVPASSLLSKARMCRVIACLCEQNNNKIKAKVSRAIDD